MSGSQSPVNPQYRNTDAPSPGFHIEPGFNLCEAAPSQDSGWSIHLQPGDVVNDRYRIDSLIGQGGMGLVYRIEQVFLGKVLALKILSNSRLSDLSVRRFHHEARAAFAIDHPNLITVHDFGVLDGKIPYRT